MASLGKLEIFEAIARDGATESYLARWRGDTWIVLRRATSDESAEGMTRVAPIAYSLDHPNVVRTFDPLGELPALRGSVLLEHYVEGERLSDWLTTLGAQPLPWYVSAAIVRDAARGVSAIQSAAQGEPHAASELWPGRLVVGYDGSVRVVDPCAELRGVPLDPAVRQRYGAPGLSGGEVDRTAAVYTLGRILGELCPTPPQDGSLPRSWQRIVSRAAAERSADRYQSCSELAAALDALLDDPEPVRAYFAERFAGERRAHTDALAALTSPPGEVAPVPSGEPSGFTDEIKTAVMPRPANPDATETMRALPDFEESGDTEELRFDEVLGDYAPDADEDLRTRPFRRVLLSTLKRNEHEQLERGGARVAVVPTAVPAARVLSQTPDENVIIDDTKTESIRPPSLVPPSGERSEETPVHDAAVMEREMAAIAARHEPTTKLERPPPSSRQDPTMVIRAIREEPRSRARDFVVLALALCALAVIAFLVLRQT